MYEEHPVSCPNCDKVVCFVKCYLTDEEFEKVMKQVWIDTNPQCYEEMKNGISDCCHCWRARKKLQHKI